MSRSFINLIIIEVVELVSNTLMNKFRNYIPNKKLNIKYGDRPRMNKSIIQINLMDEIIFVRRIIEINLKKEVPGSFK